MDVRAEQASMRQRHTMQRMLRGVLRNKIAPSGRPFQTYFIQGKATGLIKIGKAIHIRKRLAALQTGSPDELVCIFNIMGDWEKRLHKKFASDRRHGEWFAPANILTYLEYLKSNKPTT